MNKKIMTMNELMDELMEYHNKGLLYIRLNPDMRLYTNIIKATNNQLIKIKSLRISNSRLSFSIAWDGGAYTGQMPIDCTEKKAHGRYVVYSYTSNYRLDYSKILYEYIVEINTIRKERLKSI